MSSNNSIATNVKPETTPVLSLKPKQKRRKRKPKTVVKDGKVMLMDEKRHADIISSMYGLTSSTPNQPVKLNLTDFEEYPDLSSSNPVTSNSSLNTSAEVKSKPTVPKPAPPVQPRGIINIKPSNNIADIKTPTGDANKNLPASKKSKTQMELNLMEIIKKAGQIRLKNAENTNEEVKEKFVPKKEKPTQGLHPHNMLDSTAPAKKRGKEREKPRKAKLTPLKKVIISERQKRKEKLREANAEIGPEKEHEDLSSLSETENDEGCVSTIFSEHITQIDEKNIDTVSAAEHISKGTVSATEHIFKDTVSAAKHISKDTVSAADHISKDTVCTEEHISKDTVCTEELISKGTVSTAEHIFKDTVSAAGHISKDTVSTAEYISKDTVSSVEHISKGTVSAAELISKDTVCAAENSPNDSKEIKFDVTSLFNEAILTNDTKYCINLILHNRKFREYCDQLLSAEIDELMFRILSNLVRFQDRAYHKDPVKAKIRKRMVSGLREVMKLTKAGKVKCLIVAPDVQKIDCEGGLTDTVNGLIKLCKEANVDVVFGLPRRKLGHICKKRVALSCIGILNYEGTEEDYRKMKELVVDARQGYADLAQSIERKLTPSVIDELKLYNSSDLKLESLRKNFWSDNVYELGNKSK